MQGGIKLTENIDWGFSDINAEHVRQKSWASRRDCPRRKYRGFQKQVVKVVFRGFLVLCFLKLVNDCFA